MATPRASESGRLRFGLRTSPAVNVTLFQESEEKSDPTMATPTSRTESKFHPEWRQKSVKLLATASVAANGTLVYLAGSSRSEAQPVWLDRDGKELGKVRPMGDFTGLALSPDQKFVALTGSSLQPGLWLHELARDVETRFTLPPLVGPPGWSPDSRRIAFSGQHSRDVKSAGGGQEQLLL